LKNKLNLLFIVVGMLGTAFGYTLPHQAETVFQFSLPDYLKNEKCEQVYDTFSGVPAGWIVSRPHPSRITIMGEGGCAEFYRIFKDAGT